MVPLQGGIAMLGSEQIAACLCAGALREQGGYGFYVACWVVSDPCRSDSDQRDCEKQSEMSMCFLLYKSGGEWLRALFR